MTAGYNETMAARLEELAGLLADQHANPFRIRAYRHAAQTLRTLDRPVHELLDREGVAGLQRLPGIGESIAHTLQDIVLHGRSAMLERLRGNGDPLAVLQTVPGVGPALARRLHDRLGIETLHDLEAAAHDGRLSQLSGLGAKRLAGIRDSLAHRLGRLRPAPAPPPPGLPPVGVEELLDVDEEYRRLAHAGRLPCVAPRRFNPAGQAWLPILHTTRGSRHYTALFSNTARAHEAGKTHDWVVLYCDEGNGERQCTVVTEVSGPWRGYRTVRGRERECAAYRAGRRNPSADQPDTS